MVVISDRAGSTELITYSDVLWQLALEPGVGIDPPSEGDIERALDTVIKQRLFAIEAGRLPQPSPTRTELNAEIRDILDRFGDASAFEARLRRVGFDSVRDENFERLISERIRIKRYIDFRFRSFVVVTPEDEERYFRDTFLPDFRRRFPGAAEPSLAERRAEINRILIERSVAESIEAYIDEAERTNDIVYLDEVGD